MNGADGPWYFICLSFKIEDAFGRYYWTVALDTLNAARPF